MRPRPARRLILAAPVVAVLALAPACTRPDPGHAPVSTGMLTVSRPVAWQTPLAVEAPWTAGFQLAPGAVEQLQASGSFGDFVTAAEAAGSLVGIGQVGLQDFTVVQTRDLEVRNATSAQAVRYTITDNQGSQVVGEWFVAVRWPERRSVAVSILTPRYDPGLERDVIDSLRFDPGA